MYKEIVGKLVDLLRAEGVTIESQYDFENFIEDNCSHSQLKETGRFPVENAEDF